MQYRMLGNTGLKVSALSFGGIKLTPIPQKDVTALIARAHELGMNYIDTARAYGKSEELIGTALEELGLRESFIISSKIISKTIDAFKADFEVTMRNLRTDYLDILFIHDISTRANWDKVRGECLDYMRELKAQGRIRHIAISTHDATLGAEMISTGAFEVAMLAYNPTSTEVEDTLLPLCKKMGVGTVIMKPLGGGVLTEARSEQLGFSITAEECLRFAASNPNVDTVIPGLDKLEYVDTAARVGAGPFDMSAEERERIIGRADIKVKNYCRGCGYCLPCPKGIPIPTVLKLLNRWQVFNKVDWSHKHAITTEYTQSVTEDVLPSHCVSCGSCVQRCPFNLPVPELMREAAESLRRY